MPDFQTLLIYIIPLVFAITLHEAAHGWVASILGDHTARMMGRVTLDPTKHIDPIGTIAIPLVLLLIQPNTSTLSAPLLFHSFYYFHLLVLSLDGLNQSPLILMR